MTLEETIYMKICALAIAALKAFERGAGRLLLAGRVCAGRGASSDSRTIDHPQTLDVHVAHDRFTRDRGVRGKDCIVSKKLLSEVKCLIPLRPTVTTVRLYENADSRRRLILVVQLTPTYKKQEIGRARTIS